MSDQSGALVWRSLYAPFGQASVDEDPDGDGTAVGLNIVFPGQYFDAESGLHYNYFRYYDPNTGRYLTSDPIGLRGGINTYTYALNNPLYWIDPFGLDTLGIHSNVAPNAGFTAGHAWLSYTDAAGNVTNYGLWPDSHPMVPDNGPGSDVRTGMENGQIPLYSRYYDLTPEQIKRWNDFLNRRDDWSYSHTCADWASDGVRDVTGENVDADDWLGFETPRELSESIRDLERGFPTSPSSPLPPRPGSSLW